MFWNSFIVCSFFGCLTQSVYGIHELCATNEDCSSLAGSVCIGGSCVCPIGQQLVLGGTQCAQIPPYHMSECVEDFQCSRLSVAFECRRNNVTNPEGQCRCQPGHHYLNGRCWPQADFGEACSRDQECVSSTMRDPNAMVCDTTATCVCAEGYYLRQRGECRRIGYGVGDGCVINEDCQFDGGACDRTTFSCFDQNAPETRLQPQRNSYQNLTSPSNTANKTSRVTSRSHFAECSDTVPCQEPFQCSSFGTCLCPLGYYYFDGTCMAELGSPSPPEQCVGILAVVIDGICTCPANFFFDDNMRDCIRVTRFITESCVIDENCRTFGVLARCGEEQPPWGLRSCECTAGESLWDSDREMCRTFVGIGEACEFDTDCIAGEMQIQCQMDDQNQGYCVCPPGYVENDGLCLTTGLGLGDACQASAECTMVDNSVCEGGQCTCNTAGYTELNGVCASAIGGSCLASADCVIENSYCTGANITQTCQCQEGFVEYDGGCWPALTDLTESCILDVQCQGFMGQQSACVDGTCQCSSGYHFRDGGCWLITGLFQTCSRTSECYLSDASNRVVCRNSLCQCDFEYPYSEELQTCGSSASTTIASFITITLFTILSLTKIYYN